MADFTFETDENLGKVVQPKYKVFCNWSPKTPISDAYKVTRDVCGHKFSSICGFTFNSNLDAPYFILHPELKLSLQYGISDATFRPTFQVVYVPKARATHVRNDRGLSGWYLWQHIAADNKQIMSNKDFFAYYGFDVAKFFQSDMFKKYLPLFKKQIQAAYDTTVKQFVDSMGTEIQHGYSKRDCMFFSKCVVDSLGKIDDVLKINWEEPEEKKAKLAYNADDTYSLNAKNLKNLDQVSGVDATGTKIDTTAESEQMDEAVHVEIKTASSLKAALDNTPTEDLKLPIAIVDPDGDKYSITTFGKNDAEDAFEIDIDKVDENANEDEYEGPVETIRQLIARLQHYGNATDLNVIASSTSDAGKTIFKIDDIVANREADNVELKLVAQVGINDSEKDVEITEADTNEQKSEKLWNKAKASLKKALVGYNDIADYCKLIAEAYDYDSSYVPNDDPQMIETKADIEKATKALDELRKALHFD